MKRRFSDYPIGKRAVIALIGMVTIPVGFVFLAIAMPAVLPAAVFFPEMIDAFQGGKGAKDDSGRVRIATAARDIKAGQIVTIFDIKGSDECAVRPVVPPEENPS